jgi:uncharacterized protein YndB with AHSA1/START domain
MTTPNVPMRLEFEIEVPGSPDQVWAAIATAAGQSAWFLPVESDERAGGRQITHMGPEDAPADITVWDPPRRFVVEEDISALVGRPGEAVTPMVTEFLVEASAGGTCVVRVVSSAFGVGADWEQEFVDDMAANWVPFFDQLRLYLSHFPGQRATTVSVDRALAGDPSAIQAAARRALGVAAVGDAFVVDGAAGVVEQLDPVLLLRLESPTPAMVRIWTGERTEVLAYLFPPDSVARDKLEEDQRRTWTSFLDSLTVDVHP